MTLYILFAGVGILIYAGVTYAGTAASGLSSAHVAFGLQVAFLVSLTILFAADILFYANRLMRQRWSRLDRSSAWRMRIVVAAVVFLAGGVAIVLAASGEAGDVPERGPISGKASILVPNGFQAAVINNQSAQAVAAGTTLFHERGCVGCHRPDGIGVGPTLHGLFGRPVEDPGCGVAFVDEWYVRDAILNPTATVAVGFPPVMPTFQLTEEELQALVVYVESLSVPVQAQRR